jgi:hypothetical protein
MGNDNGNEAGRQQKRQGRSKGNGNGNVRVVGNKEGKNSKMMAMAMMMATGMAGEWSAMATKRLMVLATRVAGKQR